MVRRRSEDGAEITDLRMTKCAFYGTQMHQVQTLSLNGIDHFRNKPTTVKLHYDGNGRPHDEISVGFVWAITNEIWQRDLQSREALLSRNDQKKGRHSVLLSGTLCRESRPID